MNTGIKRNKEINELNKNHNKLKDEIEINQKIMKN